MLYCKKCMLLCAGEACGRCGSRKLCEAKENDPVYLVTKNIVWSGGIEDILTENKIPYLKQGLLGAGVTTRTGVGMEDYRYYVPFGAYKKSKELLAAIFADIDPG
ncbi:MAG: hypothetical protein FWF60_06695 [Oscillospiraceae bacterium]|nr:hypothetical protein [Oscillospiraceae bacterium]